MLKYVGEWIFFASSIIFPEEKIRFWQDLDAKKAIRIVSLRKTV